MVIDFRSLSLSSIVPCQISDVKDILLISFLYSKPVEQLGFENNGFIVPVKKWLAIIRQGIMSIINTGWDISRHNHPRKSTTIG